MSKDTNTSSEQNSKKEDDTMNAMMNAMMNATRPCTITESIINSCKEVKAMRDGQTPKRSWKTFAEETEKQLEEDEQ